MGYQYVKESTARQPSKGPTLAALTFAYEAYFDIFKEGGGRYWVEINRIHDALGPIVRINPWEVHIRDPEWSEAYKMKAKASKPAWFYRSQGPPGTVLQAGPHELHRMRREALLPVFATPIVMSREKVYEELVHKLISRFRGFKGTDAVVTLGDAFRCLAIDVTCTTSLGRDFGFVDVGDFENEMFMVGRPFGRMNMITRQVGHWLFEVLRAPARWAKGVESASPGTIRILHFRNMIMQAITDDYFAATATAGEKKAGIRDDKMTGEESPAAFTNAVQHVLNSNLPPDEKTMRRVIDEVWLIINAGIETEGVFMTFATFMLLKYPEKLARLRGELAECEKRLGRLPSFQELRELPYLTGVILEAFRLNHPVSSRLPRYDPNNDMRYGDTVIPRGVHVSISLYDIYLNPDIFPNPQAFEPERWLDQDDRRRLRKYVNNFGRGPRSCIGVDVANMEIYLTLGRLFAPSAGFDMELHDTLYERDVAFYYDFRGVP
ncbi:hypothetical protein INS49_011467 [Diaporthe citri]|uniref:uncharacterized protein n=1 Tax=Diaporthe citri TaxID=83186 RepID=UPI001C806760|nr:uncharacterized protein INS49_011467 [Diaporthe citri]KAG6360407.1 hypothetical protein INS49_011467 [Diaporthe citri]